MPIYEYRCQDCDHEFERMQKFSDPPIATCPTCTGPVKKLISRSAFHLKGDGWYVTDYARKGNSQNGKSSADNRSTTSDSDSKASPASEDKGASTGKGASTTSAADTTSSS